MKIRHKYVNHLSSAKFVVHFKWLSVNGVERFIVVRHSVVCKKDRNNRFCKLFGIQSGECADFH